MCDASLVMKDVKQKTTVGVKLRIKQFDPHQDAIFCTSQENCPYWDVTCHDMSCQVVIKSQRKWLSNIQSRVI